MRLCLIVVLSLLLAPLSVRAEELILKPFPTQLFEPAIGNDTIFAVEGPQVSGHLTFGVGLMMNYQHRPLVIYRQVASGSVSSEIDLDKAQAIAVVQDQMTANVTGFFSFHLGWLQAQVGLDLPINMLLKGTEMTQGGSTVLQGGTDAEFSAPGLGDLKLHLKVSLLRNLGGFSLAFSPEVTFPTGNDEGFGSDGGFSVRPRLVAGYRSGMFSMALNLGYLIRTETGSLFSAEMGNQLLYGLGAGLSVHPRVTLLAEVVGRAGLPSASDCSSDGLNNTRICAGTSLSDTDAFPLELDLGLRVRVADGVDVFAGGGFGLIRAIGSPAARIFFGMRWAPDFKDTDEDGVYDYLDKCPTEGEDLDGYQDGDGCPEPDNDKDMIPDVRDRCPDKAEDRDGFQDEDGCPELDNDGDKIPDLKDSCPLKPETFNGHHDQDGCPDLPDHDNDGVSDEQDKCPKTPEDRDGFQDEDGCPDVDNDGDGVPDQFDDCPNRPEDQDNFKDDDGCPEPDNDRDGVEDTRDRCPNEPETINGVKDDDGCPDGGASHVVVEERRLRLTQKIHFVRYRSKILGRSLPILGELALTLKALPRIRGLRIEGHTDDAGIEELQKALSQERAEAVVKVLVSQGVNPKRLFAVGFGGDKPIADNDTAQGRQQNNRLEFVILDHAPGRKK